MWLSLSRVFYSTVGGECDFFVCSAICEQPSKLCALDNNKTCPTILVAHLLNLTFAGFLADFYSSQWHSPSSDLCKSSFSRDSHWDFVSNVWYYSISDRYKFANLHWQSVPHVSWPCGFRKRNSVSAWVSSANVILTLKLFKCSRMSILRSDLTPRRKSLCGSTPRVHFALPADVKNIILNFLDGQDKDAYYELIAAMKDPNNSVW